MVMVAAIAAIAVVVTLTVQWSDNIPGTSASTINTVQHPGFQTCCRSELQGGSELLRITTNNRVHENVYVPHLPA